MSVAPSFGFEEIARKNPSPEKTHCNSNKICGIRLQHNYPVNETNDDIGKDDIQNNDIPNLYMQIFEWSIFV